MENISKKEIFNSINLKGDRITAFSFMIYFLFGLMISFFYGTTTFALVTGGALIAGFFLLKLLLPQFAIHRYYASAAYAVFMAQFIYQMHGMFEMHFFAFIGAALLISYQNWKLQIPNILVVVVHHAVFAWLQYSGTEGVYFTQMQYMDLQTFIIHGLLAALIVTILGYWSYMAESQTIRAYTNGSQLQSQITNIENNITFAEQIKRGDFTTAPQVYSTDDRLGAALLEMRDSLVTANKREQEEKYINQGVANVNEILRRNINNITQMCTELVSQITKYLNGNQAGLYLLESDYGQSYLELKAHYAYERKKFVDKRIEIGEGLVGQAYLEKEYTMITNLPDQYLSVTSGLGAATPSCLMIMPIQSNQIVVGILELASFKIFDTAQVLFLEKCCEAIGSTIASAQLSARIEILLEEAQQQSEELKSQEEEMRQNLEELQATQEESQRNYQLFDQRFNVLFNSDIAMIEFTPQGFIKKCNANFAGLFGYTADEIEGKHHRIFVDKKYAESSEYKDFWNNLRLSQQQSGVFSRITKSGKTVTIKGSYTAIKDIEGNVDSIFKHAVIV